MSFSDTINKARYAHPGETTWSDVTNRVVDTIFTPYPQYAFEAKLLRKLMREKKFLPAGRILRNTGLPYHQISNCYLLRAKDTREGWANLTYKATMMLMAQGGIGVDYGRIRARGAPLVRSGGVASGPCPLIQSINEIGRGVQCGGYRRSAIYASLPWDHPDIEEFIHAKDWPAWLIEQRQLNMDTAAPCDMTNMSVALNGEFFLAFDDASHRKHTLAQWVFSETISRMCTHGEPGFQIDFDKQVLRNAPVAGETWVLAKEGYVRVRDIVGKPTLLWTGKQYSPPVMFLKTGTTATIRVNLGKEKHVTCDPTHPFLIEGRMTPASELRPGDKCTPSSPTYKPRGEFQVTSVEPSGQVEDVYCVDVQCPEHTFTAWDILVGNCTEIISADDCDACILGHVNLAQCSLNELEEIAAMQTLFLLLCTEYTEQPLAKVRAVQRRNRRLGSGLLGVGEWFIQNSVLYGDDSIFPWISRWAYYVNQYAEQYANALSWPVPIATRALAPTGTVSIVAETTSGIEPLYATAYERRYRSGAKTIQSEVVIDPVAKRLIDLTGQIPETAYDIPPERRVAFQAKVQNYIDNAISSTINLPSSGDPGNNDPSAFSEMLYKYLPALRGITVFPDGSRGLQPIKRIDYADALRKEHVEEFIESPCVTGVCGI